jgi:hypothetical protein
MVIDTIVVVVQIGVVADAVPVTVSAFVRV